MARVLLIDDDPFYAQAIAIFLQMDQHQVWTTTDLPSALAQLQREPVDLILTDLFAPHFSPDALAELAVFSEVAPTTPIVVTTGHEQAATYDPAAYGLTAILLKPFEGRA